MYDISQITTPQRQFIGAHKRALYRAEERRTAAIKACAQEWSKVTNTSDLDYWKVALPQALFDTLEQWEPACAQAAAEAFLKFHGWTVQRPA